VSRWLVTLAAALGLGSAIPGCSPARVAEPPLVPKRFSADIGGFRPHSYSVELRDGTLTYTVYGRGHSNPDPTAITPTEAQWHEFRQTLDELQVWQWRAEYENPGALDGTGWSLDIAYADRGIKTSGSNSYPSAFKRYLAAIQQLLGGKSFE
jgi:hypothetical protein